MRSRAVEELAGFQQSPARKELRRGWCLEGAAFRERMLSLLDATREKLTRKPEADGAVRRNHGEGEASRLLRVRLAVLDLNPDALETFAKGDE